MPSILLDEGLRGPAEHPPRQLSKPLVLAQSSWDAPDNCVCTAEHRFTRWYHQLEGGWREGLRGQRSREGRGCATGTTGWQLAKACYHLPMPLTCVSSSFRVAVVAESGAYPPHEEPFTWTSIRSFWSFPAGEQVDAAQVYSSCVC